MRKILIFFIPLSFQCEAQSVFNKRFDPFQSLGDYGWSLQIDSNHIWAVFNTLPNPGLSPPWAIGILKLDFSGNVVDTHLLHIPNVHLYAGGPQSLSIVRSEGFILGGSYEDTSGDSQALLTRIKADGDTLWTRKFGNANFQSGWMAKEDDDGGFLLCGQTRVSLNPVNSDALLLKTDSLGNLVWMRNYGDSVNLELAFAFTKTVDGGYALAGETRILNVPGFNNPSLWMSKLDSLGIVQWDTIIPTISRHRLSRFWSVLSAQDGNIVVAGHYAPIQHDSHTWPVVKKFDLAGNIIWDKMYFRNDSSRIELNSLRELSDGTFIGAGFHSIPPYPPRRAFLLKLDSNGDSLWSKDYYLEPNSTHYLSDVYPTPDGGFVACGWITPLAPDTGYQDLWILKVDSMGCEISNCTVSIDELHEIIKPMNVFPVPFSSELNVSINRTIKDAEIKVYDVSGSLVVQKNMSGELLQLNTSTWDDGIYFIQLISKYEVYTAKVIKMGN